MTVIPRISNLCSRDMLFRHMQRIERPTSRSGRFINLRALSCSSLSSQNEVVSRPAVPCQSNRVPKTLYRQLLKWCRDYKDIPFNPMPPVTLSPPLVNTLALKQLRRMRALLDRSDAKDSTTEIRDYHHPAHFALYNVDIDVRDNMIIFPETKDSAELRGVIRSIYWLNNRNTIAEMERDDHDNVDDENNGYHQKERISLAFDAIKSCNLLSSTELDDRVRKRQQSIDAREKMDPVVCYHVGQVVQHRLNKWRGVVVGWNIEGNVRTEETTQNRLTSLTTKQYQLKSDGSKDERLVDNSFMEEKKKSKVKYTILVDKNDAAIMHTSKYVSLELQDNLIIVEDPCLRRIHSHSNLINKYFDRFDAKGYFVPNKVLSYVYPSDLFSGSVEVENEDHIYFSSNPISKHELHDTCSRVADGVHGIGVKLLPIISIVEQQRKKDYVSNGGNESHMSLTNALASDIQSILKDENCSKNSRTILSRTAFLLEKLYNFHLKIGSLLWTHKIHGENKQRVEFSLGEIVKHKIYGYRGVVVSWDPKPFTDVSNWDGLRNVKNANEKPFYHIRPDVNDCIRAFGGPRNFRYVCQENLERWESGRNYGEVEFETELDSAQWRWDPNSGKYVPSEELKFMYAEEIGESEEILVSCIERLREVLAECFLAVRENPDNGLFSMDDLFLLLQTAESLEDATIVQDLLKEIWKETHNKKLRYLLDSGISDLLEGKNERALDTFTSITESDPSYGEAWNKKATVHYMNGDMKESLAAAEKALELDPRNFQALAGIGLVEMDTYRWEQAIDAFRKSLDLNPWSMVSARMSVCFNRNKELPKQSEWPWNRE